MDDYLRVCMLDLQETDNVAFMGTFCQHCRNPDCTHAQWNKDKFGARVASQMERLFHPNQADPRSSRYSMLVDFGDMLEQAIRLEVSDMRGDWEIPDSLTIQNMAAQPQPVLLTPQTVAPETNVSEIQDALILPDLVGSPLDLEAPSPSKIPEVSKKAPPPMPKARNTPVQGGGVMLGRTPAPVADPWAGPEVGKVRVVPVGAKIRFGGGSPKE